MEFFYPVTQVKFTGKTLIIPIVSVANVAQLAGDLLIASYSLQMLGICDSKDLVPVVGGREDEQPGIATPIELYGREGLQFLVIQQRSPALKSRKEDFIRSLLGFIQESGVASVLFLSGVDLSNRTDAQMMTPTYYLHPSNTLPLASTPLASLHRLQIPVYTSPVPQHPLDLTKESAIPFIPGGGLTRRILSSVPPAWSIPTASLLQFVLEGDNRADAQMLATVVVKALGVDHLIEVWKQPGSWKHGLFGPPHDQTLYG